MTDIHITLTTTDFIKLIQGEKAYRVIDNGDGIFDVHLILCDMGMAQIVRQVQLAAVLADAAAATQEKGADDE